MSHDIVLETRTRDSLTVYPISRATKFGVDAFVTDRSGGVSNAPYDSLNLAEHVGDAPDDVAENRRRVRVACGRARLVTVTQVHGPRVIDAADVTDASEADAIVTTNSRLALAILVADCVPVLLVDTASARFALVHAGWRGLQRGVIGAALSHFSRASTVYAFVGPSISRDAYQVGPEVARHFDHVPGALRADVGDRALLDLRRVTVTQLLDHGVRDESVELSSQVTDGGGTFFSDRAQRPCGRFALVATRVP